jgi:hypothetical protein
MLALPEASAPPTPTYGSIQLAEDLLREALRRRHTPAFVPRSRPNWTLMAASLPLLMTALGLGAWGFQQKQKADRLASAVVQKEMEVQRLKGSHQENLQRDRDQRDALNSVVDPQLRVRTQQVAQDSKKPKELVLPSNERPNTKRPPEVQQVKK